MREEERTFKIKDKNTEHISKKIKEVLQDILDFKTSTETYIYFSNESSSSQFQSNNKIVIHHDQEKIFVLVKGDLSEMENDIIWNKLEKIIKVLEPSKEEKEDKINNDDLIKKVLDRVKNEGFQFTLEEAEKFIKNFQKKFNRYPNSDEIDSIGIGYIQMLNQKMVIEENDKSTLEKNISTGDTKGFSSISKEDESKPDQKDENKSTQIKDGIIEILKSEGRRTCPKCGNQNINTIRESIDKTTIISHYPKIFAKKYQCRLCNCEWRKT